MGSDAIVSTLGGDVHEIDYSDPLVANPTNVWSLPSTPGLMAPSSFDPDIFYVEEANTANLYEIARSQGTATCIDLGEYAERVHEVCRLARVQIRRL